MLEVLYLQGKGIFSFLSYRKDLATRKREVSFLKTKICVQEELCAKAPCAARQRVQSPQDEGEGAEVGLPTLF
ncbi:hypothetical protein D3Z36_08605 [Lachnospiraceae bacterium]|nr:hypothetical protein [Lachnospiraceae bacterium]